MKKTLLVGNFGAHNLGDEMILLAALKTYEEVVVMTADPDWTRSFCEAGFETTLFPPTGIRSWGRFLMNKTYRRQILDLKKRVDKVVFVGGGLFAIKTRACILWWKVFMSLKFLLGKEVPIIFENQGVDKKLTIIGKWCARKTFMQADFLSVRDINSQQAVLELGIEEVVLTEDRAFQYFRDHQPKSNPNSRIMAFNALSYLDLETWDQIFDQAEGFNLVFLLFEPKDRKYVPENFPGKVIMPQTKSELLEILAATRFLIAERLHAVILGACICGAANTNLLKKPYSEKVESFCSEHGIDTISI